MASSLSSPADPSAEKRRVALVSMFAAAVMTLLKLAAGLLSGSLGVLSDAAHSGLDLVGSMLTFFSVRVSDRPADADHTYGHGKFENISSFGEVLLMAASSAWIIWEAVSRMVHHSRAPQELEWPALVVAISIGVDFWRSRRLRRVAEQTGSPALATDAFHFASDIWSSLAVLCGLGASWAGTRAQISALGYADPLAAILVSLLILRLAVRLGHEAVDALLDEIPAETQRRIQSEVEQVPGILAVERTRVRRSGASYFADLTLVLPRRTTFEHTDDLVKEATEAVHRALPGADVVIHAMPRQSREESIFDRVRAVAARHNVSVHELSVQPHDGRLRVEQHMELDENLPLLKAHDFVCLLEAEILKEVPEIDAVLTHIESEPATIEPPAEQIEADRRIEETMQAAAAPIAEILNVHEIRVERSAEHIHVSCHCTLPDELTMAQVHEVITILEDHFKLQNPEVTRVTIHPEPATDNLR
ncbi:MAG: cation diffusion facilitator family transporter [Terracidiphilus sp.]